MARPKLEYRPIRREDMDSFEELLQYREMPQEPRVRRVLVEYMAFENPMAKPENPRYWVAVDESQRVMGYFGITPTTYIVQGKLVEMAVPHDLFVHPELRASGLAFFICAKMYKLVEAETSHVFPIIWSSPENRELQSARKHYKDTGGARRMARVIRAKSQLHRVREKVPFLAEGALGEAFAFAADSAMVLFDRGARAVLGRGMRVDKIDRFDARFDALADRVIPSAAIQPYKPAKLLNWKYIDRPYNQKTCYAIEKGGDLRGWVVVGRSDRGEQSVGAIVDFLAMPDDEEAIATIAGAAVQHFHSSDVALVESIVSDPRYARVFKRFLFAETSEPEYFIIGGIGKKDGPPESFVLDANNWHLSSGDTDGFLFSW
ncbi:MAG: hypothetical protein KC503_38025 [Myxococcales bacterium]|nr:hypothetical protein [Myxococcales bacterium]